MEQGSFCNSNERETERTILNRCVDLRPAWAEVRIVSNGLKRGQAALNYGRGGPEARNNHLAEGFIRKLVLNHEIVFVRTGKKYLVNFEKFVDYLNQENEAVQKGGAD